MTCNTCQPPSANCAPFNPCPPENYGGMFPTLVGPPGPPGGPMLYVENYTLLRALNPSQFSAGYPASVGGYSTFRDGGAGIFVYDPTSVVADNDGTVLRPISGIGRWLRMFSGPLNVQWFGATGAGGNYTTQIQAAINAVPAVGGQLYIPTASVGYNVNAALTVNRDKIFIYGDGPGSLIANIGVTDAIQIGDDVTTFRDIQIQNIMVTGGDASGWGINARKAYNLRLFNIHLTVSSVASGALSISEGVNAIVTGFVVGNVKGTGIRVTNASFVPTLVGNRIDGASIAAGTGMLLNTRNGTLIGNVTETLAVGLNLAGVGGLDIQSHYWEQCTQPIIDSAISSGVSITEGTFFPDATTQYSVDLQYTTNFNIANNIFTGVHAGGAPIRIQVAGGASDGRIGPNQFVDPVEVAFDSRYAQANIVLVSEQKHFRPQDYLRNSFSTWPGGTATAPCTWDNSAGTLARRADAAFGRYGLDLVGVASRINRRVMEISATQNANVRGRWVMFSIWAKTISGDATFRLSLGDGVNTVELDNTALASWSRWDVGMRVDSAATHIELGVTKLVGGTACFSAPSFYVGTTAPIASVEDELDRAMLEHDAVAVAKTGSTGETTVKTVLVPARSMGTQGALRIRAAGTATGTNAEKVAQVYFGGVLIGKVFQDIADQKSWIIDVVLVNRTAAAQTITSSGILATPAGSGGVVDTVECKDIAVDTTIDKDITVTLLLNNALDTITVKYLSVEPINGN